MELKKCKVITKNTNKETKLFFDNSKKEYIYSSLAPQTGTSINSCVDGMYIYILSDDTLSKGDYFIVDPNTQDDICKINDLSMLEMCNKSKELVGGYYKIIATSDPSLKLPSVSKKFQEKFCKLGGDILEVNVIYDNNTPKIKANKISIKPVNKNNTCLINDKIEITDFRFSRPMVHNEPLNTWSSNMYVECNGYIVSFSGDDGNNGRLKPRSIRHYLMVIRKHDNYDMTDDLQLPSIAPTFNDFLRALNIVSKL